MCVVHERASCSFFRAQPVCPLTEAIPLCNNPVTRGKEEGTHRLRGIKNGLHDSLELVIHLLPGPAQPSAVLRHLKPRHRHAAGIRRLGRAKLNAVLVIYRNRLHKYCTDDQDCCNGNIRPPDGSITGIIM